jgi:hypothetical protein
MTDPAERIAATLERIADLLGELTRPENGLLNDIRYELQQTKRAS